MSIHAEAEGVREKSLQMWLMITRMGIKRLGFEKVDKQVWQIGNANVGLGFFNVNI
jgi:hypothetical protein